LFVGGGGEEFGVLAEGFGELVAGDAEDEAFEGVGLAEASGAEGEEGGEDGFLGEFLDPIGEGAAGAEEGVEAREEVFGEFAFAIGGARNDSFGDGDGARPGQDIGVFSAYHRVLRPLAPQRGIPRRSGRSRKLLEWH